MTDNNGFIRLNFISGFRKYFCIFLLSIILLSCGGGSSSSSEQSSQTTEQSESNDGDDNVDVDVDVDVDSDDNIDATDKHCDQEGIAAERPLEANRFEHTAYCIDRITKYCSFSREIFVNCLVSSDNYDINAIQAHIDSLEAAALIHFEE